MYGKYSLFYESPKNWGYYAHAQTVCTKPLLGVGWGGGEGPGDKATSTYVMITEPCYGLLHSAISYAPLGLVETG